MHPDRAASSTVNHPVSVLAAVERSPQAWATETGIHSEVAYERHPGSSPWHAHLEHELLWHAGGVFRVETRQRSLVVMPGTGVWVPAGVEHRTVATSAFFCGYALVPAENCPPIWQRLAALTISPLLTHLLQHLATELHADERGRAESVVYDLIHPLLAETAAEIPMPRDARCRAVAEAVLADPASGWELADWATQVGASTRTLSRLFQSETTMSFGQWRTQARMHAAIGGLADGVPISTVARRVGYASTSAFTTAFRRATGRTPTTYLPARSMAARSAVASSM